jgi:hypothetical protein
MKTTLTILAAIVMPGGLIVLAVGIATFYLTRYRARQKMAALQASPC